MQTVDAAYFMTALGRTSAQAGLLVLVVLVAQWLFRGQLTPRWRCALWLLVALRLLLPGSPGSALSVFNWLPRWQTAVADGGGNATTPVIPQAAPVILPPLQPPMPAKHEALIAPAKVAPVVPVITKSSLPPVPQNTSPAPGPVMAKPVMAWSWPMVLLGIWLAGVLAMAAQMLVISIRLARKLSRLSAVETPAVTQLLQECRERLGVRGDLRVVESAEILSPALHGLFQPQLLLPKGFTTDFSACELRFVFLHELAHLKRRDLWLNWLFAVLQALHWFNPLVWLAFARWRADRELACDALVLEAAGAEQSRDYGRTILRLLEKFTHQASAPSVLGILEDRRQLKRRIEMIARFKPPSPWSAALALVLVAVIAVGCLTDAKRKGHISGLPVAGKTTSHNVAETPSLIRGDLLFVGNDWGSEIWIFDTEIGAASKSLFCIDTKGVNGLTFDEEGNLFESDFGTRSIIKFTPDGKRSTFAELDSSGGGAAFDRRGNLIVPFQWGHKIETISPDGKQRMILAQELGDPVAAVVDRSGQVFVADQKTGVIYKFALDGTRSIFAQGLGHPVGITFDRAGNLFVGSGSIYKISLDGTQSLFAADVAANTLAFDSRGNLFMTTGGGGSIYKFPNKSGKLSNQRELFASGLGHDYFMAISPKHLEYTTVKLPQGRPISGVVLDFSGRPVVGAKVRLNNYHFDNAKQIYVPEGSEDTDRDGRWRIEGLPENYQDFGVTVSHPDFPQAQFFADGPSRRGYNGSHVSTTDFFAGKAVLKLISGCKLSGAVHNEAGQPVADAVLFVGFDRYMSGAIKSRTDAQGNFNLKNLAAGENYLTVSAKGFAPQFLTVFVAASNASVEVFLKPGKTVRGRVEDAAGKRIANANVSYDGCANRNSSFSGRTIEWNTKTDENGEFTWDSAPAEPVRLSIRKAGYMALQWLTVQTDTTAVKTFTLGSPFTVKGSVTDADSGERVAKFTVTPGWPEGSGGARLEKNRAAAGTDGHYEVHFDSPIIISPTPYDFVFQVSAPGYAPAQSRAIKPDEGTVTWDVKLKKTPATIATVKTADGKPAVGVKVFQAGTRDYLQLDGTEVSNQNRESESFETDANGRFELPPQTGAFNLVAAAPAGFALASQTDFTNNLTLTLQPWGRVEGTLLRNGQPLPGRELYFFIGDGTEQRNVWMKTPVTVDAQGRFTFPFVPAGTVRIQLKQPMTEHSWSYTELQTAEVKPGATTTVQATLNGRDVVGRWKRSVDLPADVNLEQGQLYLRPDVAQPPVPEGLDDQEKVREWYQAWGKTEDGKKFMEAQRKSGQLQMKADGTLRGESVAPGKYTLSGNFWGNSAAVAEVDSRKVVIPESTTNDADVPFDIGEVLVKAVKHLNIGETAPDFNVKTLDDQPLKLADFCGKYVLVDFWATWCGPCVAETPHMKAAYDAYGSDPRFVMISLSLDQKTALPKKFALEHNIKWLQGFLGDWSKDTVTKDYCVRGIPSIFLIGPDGKIIAQNLRGEAINSVIGSALGTK